MISNGSDVCFGLVLLLEAAEHHDAVMVTPSPCTKKRVIASPSTLPTSPPPFPVVLPNSSNTELFTLPPKKRMKHNFADSINFNCHSPSSGFKFSPIKKSSKCPSGSAHRIWEGTDECAVAAASTSRFNSSTAIQVTKTEGMDAEQGDKKSFVLYNKDDDKHINALHNIVRRDIWEGFVVDASTCELSEDSQDGKSMVSSARRAGRLARYEGTIGFRCRFCKDTPLDQRAERSAVYPRSLERIYLANIRFQRDHIEHCTFIPKDTKDEYLRLKGSKGISRGRKQYWVTSARCKGLSNGEKGIVFSP